MRADAQANYDRLLVVAAAVLRDKGADASLRDVARQAGVGLATLLRHFPTREVLLEALLRTRFDELTIRATEVRTTCSPEEALALWLRDFVACTTDYRGVVVSMMEAIQDPESALHYSCVTMREAGTELLVRAQEAKVARADIDGTDLFALGSSLTWLAQQPGLETRTDHFFDLILGSILTDTATRTF